MKKLIQIAFLLLGLQMVAIAQKSNCSRVADFGQAHICLPILKGYQECYLEPNVKQIADGTEVPANMVLGYYLNDASYKKQLNNSLGVYDDFVKVYGTKQIQDYKAGKEVLLKMKEVLGGNFITKNWSAITGGIDSLNLGVEIGVPVIIKSYELNDASFTYVMMVKYALEDGSTYTTAMTINGIILKERLVWMAYYLEYAGEHSINRLQQNSNSIIAQMLKANL